MNLIENILRGNLFIGASRGMGKSSTAMLIADILKNNNVRVVCIDSSRAWVKRSSLPYYITIPRPFESQYFHYWNFQLPDEDLVLDVSRLSTFELREFTNGFMQDAFNNAVELDRIGIQANCCVVFEEMQHLTPNGSLRSNNYQEINRYICVGRNFNCCFIGTTQRLASVDTQAVENCDLRYFGRLSGDNNLRKLRALGIPKENIKRIQDLQVGEFLVHCGTETYIEKLPYFKSRSTPQEWKKPEPTKKQSLLARIFGW